MRSILAAGAAVLALAVATPALAWGPKGHRVVVYIAAHYVAAYDGAKGTKVGERMNQLLAGKTQPSSDYDVFAEKGNWGDAIKYESPAQKKRTKDWHYVDIAVGAPSSSAASVCAQFKLLAAGVLPSNGGPDCVVSKIDQFRKALANKDLDPAERELALLHLMHLVGDIHQPLHAAEWNSDGGGNATNIVFPKQTLGDTLHGFWDGNVAKGSDKVVGDALIARIDNSDVSTWFSGSNATASGWAASSHTIADVAAYQQLTTKTRACWFQDYAPPGKPKPPPVKKTCFETKTTFYGTARDAADEQLMYAGYRLAQVIIEGLKDG